MAIVAIALLVWRDDVLEALLDPKIPFAVYRPPAAPNYALASAWARLPGPVQPADGPSDIFFLHPTTFDGGKDWNGAIGEKQADRRLFRTMLPNYAAPFAASGRVFAPRYRQASLYTSLSLFDDAVEARQFAYRDAAAAFASFLTRIGPDRPFFIVGVEQGGSLAERLLLEVVGPDPLLRRRLIAGYLIETAVPAAAFEPDARIGACTTRQEAGCVVAWVSAPRLDFVRARRILDRSLVWDEDGHLVGLDARRPLCVNPLLGAVSEVQAPPRLALGAANATGLEWGVRPGLMARQIGAQCQQGVLRVSQPRSDLLRPSGDWADRLRVPGYNLFWADLEADAAARQATWLKDAR
ncbi:MAG TPA: DUF3089 domain-containing protein [Caulobacteraceae bacterium]|jgi:hypothetical protein|nr:DUF3089 domain-containing protein [Caulobacteraceae bacterium]